MRRRHPPLPRLWLMTDERIADLPGAVARLPKGSGVVFRHHATDAMERLALFRQVRQIACARRLTLILADTPRIARAWGAVGAHHRSRLASRGLRTMAVHNGRELATARRTRADLIFVSPVFPTRSHPGARILGPVRLGLMIGAARRGTIALGGMTAGTMRRLQGLGLHGWAAIDALS
jgi:thiamine-phosphate pyrophosphorylase